MAPVTVQRTYLQLLAPGDLHRSPPPRAPGSFADLSPCPVEVSRRLYREVGERYHWRDRLAMSDAELAAWLERPEVRVIVHRDADGIDDGFFELCRHADGSVEIVLFGLMERAQGQGLGKWMLQRAVDDAWALGATRVWLHTCTLDSPVALPNYLARGFTPYRTEQYDADLPAAPGA